MLRWRDDASTNRECPVCSNSQSKTIVLTATLDFEYELLKCRMCGAAFYDPFPNRDYGQIANAPLAEKFYVEQGAGIGTMLEPLRMFGELAIKRYLEIGCGFGFSLDYAKVIGGWTVRGYDPGPLAAAGRQQLELDILSANFDAASERDADWDAVLISEVLEHIDDPLQFLAALRGVLREGGVLALTTPNADAVRPDTTSGALYPLLSVGHHAILYTKSSLQRLLEKAGFASISIVEKPFQLKAVASSRPLPITDAAYDLGYIPYLTFRSERHDPMSPLGSGFRYRLAKELVCSSQYDEALSHFHILKDAYLARYGFDLLDAGSIILSPWKKLSFEDILMNFPANLTGCLYYLSIIQQRQGKLSEAAASLEKAATFAARLRFALHGLGSDDGETEDLERVAIADRITLLARIDPRKALVELASLADHLEKGRPTSFSQASLEQLRRSLFVNLVNCGAYTEASTLAKDCGYFRDAKALAQNDLSLLFCVGMLLLNHKSDYTSAARCFEAVHTELLQSGAELRGHDLFWPSSFHQALALTYDGSPLAIAEAKRLCKTMLQAGASEQEYPNLPTNYKIWAEGLISNAS